MKLYISRERRKIERITCRSSCMARVWALNLSPAILGFERERERERERGLGAC
jgi:hypothetical protein